MLSKYELRVLRELEADLEGPPRSRRTAPRRSLRWVGAAGVVLWGVVIAVLAVVVDLLAALIAAITSLAVVAGSTLLRRQRLSRIWQWHR
jgi:Flp pilus assembly protein TadB